MEQDQKKPLDEFSKNIGRWFQTGHSRELQQLIGRIRDNALSLFLFETNRVGKGFPHFGSSKSSFAWRLSSTIYSLSCECCFPWMWARARANTAWTTGSTNVEMIKNKLKFLWVWWHVTKVTKSQVNTGQYIFPETFISLNTFHWANDDSTTKYIPFTVT